MSQPFITSVVRGASALLLAALAAREASAQFDVGLPGSGAPFEDIQSAIDAAAPGATIRIDNGVYAPFRVDKPLTILGHTQSIVSIDAPAPRTAIEVTGIAAGGEVRLAGLTVWMVGFVEANDLGLHVHDCDGRVVCADVQLGLVDIVSAASTTQPKVLIADCAAVSMSDAVLSGHVIHSTTGTHDKTALLVERSNVWLVDTRVRAGFDTGVAQPVTGSPAIRAVDSELTLTRVRAEGGGGALGLAVAPNPAPQGPSNCAVELLRSSLRVEGGPNNEILGGSGAGTPAEGVRLLGDATLAYTVDAAILDSLGVPPVGGAASFGSVGTGNSVLPLGRKLPTISPTTPYANLGSTAVFDLSGSPSSVHVVFVALGLTDPIALAPLGTAFLDPSAALHLATLAADPLGEALLFVNVPTSPSFAGLFAHLQGVEVSTFGLTLGNVATLVLRP